MNVEEIRRRIREREGIRVNFQDTPKKEEEKQILLRKDDSDEEEEYKPHKGIERNPRHTDLFDLEGSSEEEEPQSRIWEKGEDMDFTFSDNPNDFLKGCDLYNEVYDWREKTKKGRKSRENFSNYIVNLSYT